jgi:hypothetical protein
MSPADCEERPDTPALAEFLDVLAPLRRSIEIPDALTRTHEITARDADGHEVAHLAGERRRGGLVESRHAVSHLPLADEGQSVERSAQHLKVQELQGARDLRSLGSPKARRRRIVPRKQCEVSLPQREPSPLRNLR